MAASYLGASVIFVHLNQSWRDVVSGVRSAAEVTLGDWALVADAAIEQYGDVVCGVFAGEVVTAFDVDGYIRRADGRVRFTATPSAEWASLVGDASPVTWSRGQARPIRYLDTEAVRTGTVAVEETEHGGRRAVVGEFTLTVTEDGTAILLAPAGGSVTITSRAA